ncbi:MAG TPA: VOC family protein [Bryobacteraceae bacterium]|nr:VOC family protein [Bryobacteraceae bacterium]
MADTEVPLRFAALDHVGIAVTDVEKSVSFYARIFGNAVLKNNSTTRRYLKLGPCYVAIAPPAQGEPAHRVDHICAGIGGFQMAAVKSFLEARGIPSRESNVGLFVTDPDGIQVQLFSIDSWKELGATASPDHIPAAGGPIFQPTGLDHILLRVTDPEKSAPFYSKIFGPVTQRANNRTWFQVGKSRIGLIAADTGHPTGVDHFCVSAPSFDYADAIKKLEAAGAKTQPPEVAGAPEFHDPENILVQVMGPRRAPSK